MCLENQFLVYIQSVLTTFGSGHLVQFILPEVSYLLGYASLIELFISDCHLCRPIDFQFCSQLFSAVQVIET